ncbi:hypothetical protein [Rhizobium sp. RU36D]|uniref:hypothetical protein n=1 Tax=Rhizobium sp. RU36D TaxID=1907415 RepID=UPI0009D80029|nr:hypothetical protein [Rhizobium sp. RU36D]SMC88569.1 hypothetical protein SAMN05880593_10928 [Rhizobium sp. RU36D]
MNNLRSLGLAVAGVAIIASAAVFTLSLTVLLGGLLTISLLTRMVTGRLKGNMVHARAPKASQQDMRIWNDGRGTIIDL